MSIIDIHQKLQQAQREVENDGADAIVIMIYRGANKPSMILSAADDIVVIGLCETTSHMMKAKLEKTAQAATPAAPLSFGKNQN